MPAIISHYFFGQDAYQHEKGLVGPSIEERDAFLLGNQGPDPIYFTVLAPPLAKYHTLAVDMHHEKTSELLASLKQSLETLSEEDRAIGNAYALGFLCHYMLDANVHPLVYAQQYAYCSAGEPDLEAKDSHEVHATIESELDEVMLYRRTGKTIHDFSPEKEALHANGRVLSIASRMYLFMALTTYQRVIPARLFSRAVACYRLGLRALRSPRGIKRTVLSRVEQRFRAYSFYGSMSHRAIELENSAFENQSHKTWEDPFKEMARSESFEDLFECALAKAHLSLAAFSQASFDVDSARQITKDLNFLGESTVPTLLVVENE
ncbi:MAG: zinc dependent phospholipase C family protein [Eggerthellaceae bacterium]|nr:zinc dependent phospholipase C family protein [Eggerthellaceae bacterium]